MWLSCASTQVWMSSVFSSRCYLGHIWVTIVDLTRCLVGWEGWGRGLVLGSTHPPSLSLSTPDHPGSNVLALVRTLVNVPMVISQLINRPGVAGAVLQTPPSFIH